MRGKKTVELLEAAWVNTAVAARCMREYRRGEDTRYAEVGSILEAEFFALVRATLTGK